MATMNISLPDTMRKFVEEEIDRGGYATASEYFRTLVGISSGSRPRKSSMP